MRDNPLVVCSALYHSKLDWKDVAAKIESLGPIAPLRSRPTAITNFQCRSLRKQQAMELKWTSDAECNYEYVLQMCEQGTENWETVYRGSENKYTLENVAKGSYRFRVCGTNMVIQGPWNCVQASTHMKFLCIACTDAHVNDMQTVLSAAANSNDIDKHNGGNAPPTLQELLQYDAVIVHSFQNFSNPTAYGNVLADYVENDGRLVVSGFTCWPGKCNCYCVTVARKWLEYALGWQI